MSLWAKTQQLQQFQAEAFRQVQTLYQPEHFPIEVRHYLAHWIEDQNWSDLDPDNPAHEQIASAMVTALIQELERTYMATDDANFVMKLKLSEAAATFRQRYVQNPMALVRTVQHCLRLEHELVQQAEQVGVSDMSIVSQDPLSEILEKLNWLKQRTRETQDDLRRMEREQEDLEIQYHECTKIHTALSNLHTRDGQPGMETHLPQLQKQKEAKEKNIQQKAAALVKARMDYVEKQLDTFNHLQSLQSRILENELILWKRDQQLAGNGAPFTRNLDQIQTWCEGLAESIWGMRQQIKEFQRLRGKIQLNDQVNMIEKLDYEVTKLLSTLVTSTFIIEKQPPQVMKTNTRFTATVRLLVGGKLNVHMTPPQVTVKIVSEAQAKVLLRDDKAQGARSESSGEILNNTGTMEYNPTTRHLAINFRNMQLRKIKRAEKKGTESVMDEKFSLLFLSHFKIGGDVLIFQVWTLSLPVVVIVHGNQEPHAWATVSWDNAHAEPGRAPFVVPDKVPWPMVADMLNKKFMSVCGRSLTEDNFNFLAGKAFRNHSLNDYSQLSLSWSQFCKEPLPERNFTFWEWFYGILKLTRENLRALWNDGSILGFIGKAQTTDILLQCQPGTFLLRYSDSELGGISIATVTATDSPSGPSLNVDHFQPWTHRDLTIRSLPDRIHDLSRLTHLYPNIPKDDAFGRYYTPINDDQPQTGYIRPMLVTHIPSWNQDGGGGGGYSYPSTPQSYQYPQSPAEGVIRREAQGTPPDHIANQGSPTNDRNENANTEMIVDYEEMLRELSSGVEDFPVDFTALNLMNLLPECKAEVEDDMM
ncbi:unnamed protein product [Darwinula stevensoni]|uniref:Signal transducer and activator of transcription n=1 Tax=Darwinula stevensoni TaxID=69355 RepID=A0A7R9A9G7_9CRUS|nr:unnamed protein product [Darwinula stevensoni]CAG0897387.1 unnamed protein product [Darwinula stevensoni]